MADSFACQKCRQLVAICSECPCPPAARWCHCGTGYCHKCAPNYGRSDFHEQVKLFEPAPNQIPGQLGF